MLAVELADLVMDPVGFVAAVRRGLPQLGDAEYEAFQHRIAPGLGPSYGVRSGAQTALQHALLRELRDVRPSALLYLADALLNADGGPGAPGEAAELRWLAIALLDRIVPADPERAWQLLRRIARRAHEWITVDLVAHPYGRGILLEPYRWAELEQLAYSPSAWERRLVGSTIATIPFVDHAAGRDPDVARRGLTLIADLIGDAVPDVQKALSWALRNLTYVDAAAVEAFCRREAAAAAEADDGHRAWVVRDTLAKLPDATAAELRASLAGIRRRPHAPSTSRAAAVSAAFGALPDPTTAPEPPL